MNVLQELEMAQTCLLQTLTLLRKVILDNPDAEAKLKALTTSDAIDADLRALLKCTHALAVFALAQERAERDVIAAAEAQSVTSRWVN